MENTSKYPAMDWLLEEDTPEVRYLALRDLVNASADDPELIEARRLAHTQGPIAHILKRMDSEGFWVKPGPGYGPKYKSTVWALQLLAQLGADIRQDDQIRTACEYFFRNAITSTGQVSYNGAPSGTFDCLQGNMCWALLALGFEAERLAIAYNWMARTVTGEGIAPASDRKNPQRFYAYKCAPLFACGANGKLPCAWGGAKVMMAFAVLSQTMRNPVIDTAIHTGAEFFLESDLAQAEYPHFNTDHPSRNWWKFGFPVYYISDILQVVDALTALGYGNDPRLKNALHVILEKQDENGRWPLEYNYGSKTWRSYGRMNQPNKWVTLRALRVLQRLSNV